MIATTNPHLPAAMEQKPNYPRRAGYELPALPSPASAVLVPAWCPQDKLGSPGHRTRSHAQMPGVPGRLYCPGHGDQHPYCRGRLAEGIIDHPMRCFIDYIHFMEKFLFIIREELKTLKAFSEEERNVGMREMARWVESLAESWNYVGGEPLAITGRYVSKDNIVTDGPFIEAK